MKTGAGMVWLNEALTILHIIIRPSCWIINNDLVCSNALNTFSYHLLIKTIENVRLLTSVGKDRQL